MKRILCLLALAGGLFADTNLTGNWTGTFAPIDAQGVEHTGPALLKLKQTGTEISGSVGPGEDEQHAITKGKIEGNKVTLEVAEEGHNMVFTLTLAEDSMKGDVNASHDGQQMKAKLDVKRAK
ncbi:MAG: hypothetical protein C5B56_06805 [Proteobacteria bacterium]|nr:MAG: hypothetical protein C5B56_06805 [Pseudomonadota bacterium]